ncbi:MAG: hypothetical protein HW421_1938, partial [Ignavibacteria bacterium]|nr:hypothetical protein [Ignavibacteria bacterium]
MKKLVLIAILFLSSYALNAQGGEAYSWGYNAYGQLGDGTTTNKNSPVQIGTGTNWTTSFGGYFHSIAIKSDATLWAWGYNGNGQLGDGTTTQRNSPVQTGTGTNWVSASGGGYHTAGIKTDGTLWAWGNNAYGQLGDGTTTQRNSPVQIGTGTNWVMVSCGSYNTIAIKSDGTLWAWGYNGDGELGDGTTTQRNSPIQIGTGTNWSKVNCGDWHTIAIKSDGTLWAWGWNSNGQVGDGTSSNIRLSPVQIGTGTNWASVSGGYAHTIAIKNDGTLWSWGRNDAGQLGDGSTTQRNSPVQIGTGTNWASASNGEHHNCAIRSDGTLWSWGNNTYGQLGDGTTTNRISPIQIGTSTNWISASCSAYHTHAINGVNDTPCSASCKNFTTNLNSSGNATISASDIDNGSTGQGTLSFSVSPSSFNCSNVGQNSVTLTVTDQNNSVSRCTSIVTIQDLTSPTVLTKDATIYLDASGNANLSVSDVNNGSSDNCGISNYSLSKTSFGCNDASYGSNGTLSVNMSADNKFELYISTDNNTTGTNILNGNNWSVKYSTSTNLQAGQDYWIHVKAIDLGLVEMFIGDFTLTGSFRFENGTQLLGTNTTNWKDSRTAFGQNERTPYYVGNQGIAPWNNYGYNGGAGHIWDSVWNTSGNDTIYFSAKIITTSNVNNVTLTVTDVNGNSATNVAKVIVKDNLAPIIITKNITVYLDANGNASITANDVNNGSTDNCGISTLTVTPNTFNCLSINGTNNALSFNGSNSRVSVNTTSALNNLGTGNMTIEAWVNSSNMSNVNSIIRKTGDYNLYMANGKLYAEYWPNGIGNSTWRLVTGTNNIPANTWTHVAFVLNAGTPSLYINGVFESSSVSNGNISGTENLNIGMSTIYNQTFIGTIDEVRVWNTARTSTELNASKNSYLAGNETGLVGYWSFNEGSGSTTADNQTNRLNNGTLNNNTWTSGNPNFTGGNNVTLTATDASGNSSSAMAVVTIADNTPPTLTCASNVTVNSSNTSCNANVTVTSPTATDNCSSFGNALNFASAGSNYVNIPRSISGDFTIEYWMKTTQTAPSGSQWYYGTGVVDAEVGGVTNDFGTSLNGSKICFGVGNPDVTIFSTSNVNTGNWVHVAVTRRKSTGQTILYVNGVQESSGTGGTQDLTVPSRIIMGIQQTFVNGYYNGSLDEVRIWNTVRTQSDISSNMNSTVSNSSTGLVARYSFDQGTANGNNTSISTVTNDQGNTSNNGSIVNFTKTGTTSNFVNGRDGVTLVNNFNNTSNASGNYPVGQTNVVWTATDSKGNSATCNQTVTVNDATAPVTKTKSVTVFLNASGNASITTNDVDNGSTDNCGIASLSLSKSSFNCSDLNAGSNFALKFDGSDDRVVATSSTGYPQGSSARTVEFWMKTTMGGVAALHSYGNFSSQQRSALYLVYGRLYFVGEFNDTYGSTTTVNDGNWHHVGYTLTGQNIKFYIDGQLNYSTNLPNVPQTNGSPWAMSNTSGVNYTREPFNGYMDELRVWNVVRSATDIFNNYKTPLLGNESNLVAYYNFDEGSGSTLYDATSNHNNGTLTNMNLSNVWVSGVSYFNSVQKVTLTATDNAGNSSSAVAIVTVKDNIAPTAIAKNITVNLNASGNATITANDVNDNSSDNCGIASMTLDKTSFNCSNAGTNNVTLTVKDASGNTSTANAVVTVMDVTPPNAVAKNITIQLDGTGNASITASDVNNNSTDACGIASISASPLSFDCSNVGANNVILTVTDNNGNVSTATSVVTLQDATLPSALAQNITIQLDASGNASITASDVNNNSSDNCGIASMSVSPNTFNCSNVGNNTVTLTVTDNNGNVSTANSVVTVQDVTAATAIAQNLTIQLDASGNASITASDINNNSSDACGIASLSVSPNSFNCSNVGNNTVTLTVTDNNGHVSTATSVVTVQDVTAPTAIAQNLTIQLDASGNASITANDVNNNSSDACGIASMSVTPNTFNCSNVGNNTVTLTVTDNNGNTSTANSVVTVQDVTAPTTVAMNITIQLDASGNASITASDVNNNSSDACGIASMSVSPNTFNCSNVGNNTVTLTVTDNNGNISTATSVVTVQDVTAPTAITKNITVYLNASGNATITASDVNDNSSDVCGIASLSVSPNSFYCNNVGNNTVTLTVTDNNGNVSTATAVVTVRDNTAPTISVTLTPNRLWPPNHSMRTISASVSVNDNCTAGLSYVLESVTSNEPDNGQGDGDTPNDIQGVSL